MAIKPIPDGYHSVTPYLVDRDALQGCYRLKKSIFLFLGIPMSRLLLLSLALFVASEVRAQPLFHKVETLDWMAADSQVVVRGVVADFVQEVDVSRQKWITVVIKVRETLKGRHQAFHTYVVPDWDHHEVLRWKEMERELLVFLADTRPVNVGARWWAEKAALYERTLRNAYGSVIELTAPAKLGTNSAHLGQIYTLDLQDPTEPKKILQYTRAAIAAADKIKALRAHQFRWPTGNENIDRIVPVDERLERQARRWIESVDQTWRWEGARALKHFKSDENVAALKKLLKDPSFVTHVRQEGERAIATHREYLVRQAAFASLKEMGSQVSEPVVREPVPQEGHEPLFMLPVPLLHGAEPPGVSSDCGPRNTARGRYGWPAPEL